jgi:hypothetical protein
MTNPIREALAEARDMLPKIGEPENVWTMVKAPTLRALVGAIDELLETQRKFGTMMHEQLADAERRVKFTAERWAVECEREHDAAFNEWIEAAAKACEGMHEEDRPGDYAYAVRALKREQT